MGVLSYLLATGLYANDAINPTGYWKTIDDVTGKPKAIVEILTEADSTLVGKVLKIFPQQGQPQIEVCRACEGKKHNQRIVGLTVIEKLKPSPEKNNEWLNGEILDPKNGKVYHCNIRLTDNGQKLQVRGYLGLPLFGRTQTWIKVKEPAIS
ncbi:MAG: DUF2147 domain-containing protein [Gammaproteobacteria bacterium]|nr:DUF2147 domain-containing protein [Gammaproteobacteria bacterium]